MAMAKRTVTGTRTNADGTPAVGSIEFTPSHTLIKDDVIYEPKTQGVYLDATGSFSIDLFLTDDPAVTPDWLWIVDEKIPNGKTWCLCVPLASVPGTALDISEALNLEQANTCAPCVKRASAPLPFLHWKLNSVGSAGTWSDPNVGTSGSVLPMTANYEPVNVEYGLASPFDGSVKLLHSAVLAGKITTAATPSPLASGAIMYADSASTGVAIEVSVDGLQASGSIFATVFNIARSGGGANLATIKSKQSALYFYVNDVLIHTTNYIEDPIPNESGITIRWEFDEVGNSTRIVTYKASFEPTLHLARSIQFPFTASENLLISMTPCDYDTAVDELKIWGAWSVGG